MLTGTPCPATSCGRTAMAMYGVRKYEENHSLLILYFII